MRPGYSICYDAHFFKLPCTLPAMVPVLPGPFDTGHTWSQESHTSTCTSFDAVLSTDIQFNRYYFRYSASVLHACGIRLIHMAMAG